MRTPAHVSEIGKLRTSKPFVAYAVLVVFVVALLTACVGSVSEVGAVEAVAEEAVVAPAAAIPADVSEIEPLSVEEAVAPVRLLISEIGLDVAVSPMEWQVVTIGGQRTTTWDVPLDSIGWHTNSAGVGAAGNIVLSGRQADGDAVLEALALGSVVPGQEAQLTDENGRVFVYVVRDVSDPIPVTNATENEQAQALAYLALGDGAVLTLITGWPEFTTTHRIFAVADLVGVQE